MRGPRFYILQILSFFNVWSIQNFFDMLRNIKELCVFKSHAW